MKTHKTTTPNFYSRFQCTGPACIDHCCHSWDIYIDKKTYKKYESTQDEKIKALAKNALFITRRGYDRYAKIRLDNTGTCPMLSEDKLCMVHANMGADALSVTCKTFPRLSQNYQNETLHSLTMSCPEVVNQVLFQPDSMLVDEKITLVTDKAKQINQQSRLLARDQAGELVNLFCRHLAMADSTAIEDNLFALANFIIYLQQIDYQIESNVENLENVYLSLNNQLAQGEIGEFRSQLKGSSSIKVALLSIFGDAIRQTRRNKRYMVENHQAIASYLFGEKNADEAELAAKFDALNVRWAELTKDSCLAEEHVLKNYVLYHLYNSGFPGDDISKVLRKFYLLIADYFYLKISLSVRSLTQEITVEEVMRLFGSYHVIYNHNGALAKELNTYVDKINAQDDLSCLLLIN